MSLVLLLCGLQAVIFVLVEPAKITYYMDDFKACGAMIKDANMEEGDVYHIVSHQWSDAFSREAYGPAQCSIAFDFITKQVKVAFESFQMTDCDALLQILDGPDADSPVLETLSCLSKAPEPFQTTSAGVRVVLKRQNARKFSYSLNITAVGSYYQLTAGVIAGIVMGIILLILAIVAAAFTYLFCRRRKKMLDQQRRAYQSPALLEREEGLTIVNRLGISREEIPRDLPRPNHRRAYRHSYVSTSSQHTPTDEGPPPYQSMPDLHRSRNRNSHVAEPEDVSDRSLTLTAADYPDCSVGDQSDRMIPLEDVFVPSGRSRTLDYRTSPVRTPAQETRSLLSEPVSPLSANRSPAQETRSLVSVNVSPAIDNRSILSETSQTESAQNDSGRTLATPIRSPQQMSSPMDDYRPRERVTLQSTI